MLDRHRLADWLRNGIFCFFLSKGEGPRHARMVRRLWLHGNARRCMRVSFLVGRSTARRSVQDDCRSMGVGMSTTGPEPSCNQRNRCRSFRGGREGKEALALFQCANLQGRNYGLNVPNSQRAVYSLHSGCKSFKSRQSNIEMYLVKSPSTPIGTILTRSQHSQECIDSRRHWFLWLATLIFDLLSQK